MRTSCVAQGTRLSALWWPRWERNLKKRGDIGASLVAQLVKKRGYMYTYGWFTLLFNRKWHSSIKQLYSNKNKNENKSNMFTWKKGEAYMCWFRWGLIQMILMLGKIEGMRRRGRQRTRWLDGITNSMEVVRDREAWRTAVHGVVKS